ncbi:hypothetical protein DRO91_04545 [Candidatus Heimdallarchaeota archaeon]|nr:MAG: hypothetical protein DRP02_02850 [Candidatus Gerdarchaeota archaeon]RLI72416.1 MAG: hypothetical protein DRO91_04545 [Candidatus Heimdallarchaeota archaeon]
MSGSRGGLETLQGEKKQLSAKIPVSARVVKESLKSIILDGESELDRFVSHRLLYIFGFLTGWNPRLFSLELLPIGYFFIWAIVLFSLRDYFHYALLFLASGVFVMAYFIFLHTFISSWDKIKRWFIKRARKCGGVKNMTLDDVRFLLVYTRKVFSVKATIREEEKVALDPDRFRKLLVSNKRWQYALNATIILELFLISGGGIYGFIRDIELIPWLSHYWFLVILLFLPIIIVAIGLKISKLRVKMLINRVPIDDLDQVLTILNEFRLFGFRKRRD